MMMLLLLAVLAFAVAGCRSYRGGSGDHLEDVNYDRYDSYPAATSPSESAPPQREFPR